MVDERVHYSLDGRNNEEQVEAKKQLKSRSVSPVTGTVIAKSNSKDTGTVDYSKFNTGSKTVPNTAAGNSESDRDFNEQKNSSDLELHNAQEITEAANARHLTNRKKLMEQRLLASKKRKEAELARVAALAAARERAERTPSFFEILSEKITNPWSSSTAEASEPNILSSTTKFNQQCQ